LDPRRASEPGPAVGRFSHPAVALARLEVTPERGGAPPSQRLSVSETLRTGLEDHRSEAGPTLASAPSEARRKGAALLGTPVRQQYRRLYLAMALTDAAAIAAVLALLPLMPFAPASGWEGHLVLLLVSPLVVGAVFSTFHLYGIHLLASAEEFRRLILAATVTVVVLVASPWWPRAAFGRFPVVVAWLGSLVLILATRRMWHRRIRRARSRGVMIARTLIVGANEEGAQLADGALERQAGLAPVGLVATPRNGHLPDVDVPVLGTLDQLPDVITGTAADCILVASTAVNAEEMRFISKVSRRAGTELRVTANLPEVLTTRLSVQPIGGVIALSLRPVRLSGPQALAKRTFDVAVSAGVLLVALPVLVAIGVMIKLTTPGPLFYRQQRVGKQGDPFTLLKFRTMVPGADAMLDLVAAQNEADGPLFKIRNDPRTTRVGKWLRRWSLDEVPQLLNVLKGDMSLVGPRPPLPHEVRAYEDWHFDRLEVRPGITGLWQVSGRSDLSFSEMVRLDLFYIENWSLAYDMFILIKTIPAVASSRGAY
jgi:exopolysaccharide biosynthesis polyprenyl glycosylphosphotransferase